MSDGSGDFSPFQGSIQRRLLEASKEELTKKGAKSVLSDGVERY
jgi:hypothetical protein